MIEYKYADVHLSTWGVQASIIIYLWPLTAHIDTEWMLLLHVDWRAHWPTRRQVEVIPSSSHRNRTAKPATLAMPTTMICCTAAADAPFSSLSSGSLPSAEAPVEDEEEEEVEVPVLAEAEVVTAGSVWDVWVTPGHLLTHAFMVS